ncbi:MAG TPA: type II toxin-antitoxin system VapC family toxin [Beijerinckiaceae bacterium]|nr:type II toxin-antitoxin system VapC family toxin [Beijerinckiaceae bacterium]
MTLIVDASVAAKWLFDEIGSAEAHAIAERPDLVAPEFLMLECHHILWKRYRRQETTWAAVIELQVGLQLAFETFFPDADLRPRAVELSLSHSLAIYDCLYIALARSQRAPLITADDRQFAAARKAGVEVEML